MKRILFAILLLAGSASAQWTEGGARIGEHLDTLVVTFQGMGTLFYLATFGDAPDLYMTDTSGLTRISFWGDGASSGGQLNMYDATGGRTITLRAGSTGDASVVFPQDAISSWEIFNEAGVVSASDGLGSITLSGGGIRDTLLVQSIQAPDTGFLLVLGMAQPTISHTSGSTSGANFGLMLDGTIPSNQDVALNLPGNTATGSYTFPVMVQLLLPVSAGAHDVVLFGQQFSTSGTFNIYDMQLSVVYLPTAYGTVAKVSTANVPDAQASPRTTPPSIQQIRAESEAANQARIQAELTKIKAQLAQLEDQLRRSQK